MEENDIGAGKRPSVVIIGAGISGLTCAYELSRKCPNLNVIVLEKDLRAGGVIKSVRYEDTLIECGPESFTTLKPDVLDIARELDISSQIIQTKEANRRSFVSLKQELHALPEGFIFFAPTNLWSFALTDLFSIYGKLRMSMDIFLPKSNNLTDESLSEFVTRRLGTEALNKLAEPMIGGIYGGDPQLLSAQSTVPQLVELERRHGSIIRGLIKTRKKQDTKSAGPRYGSLASFEFGIESLVESLLSNIPRTCIQKNKNATHIIRGRNGSRWTVLCSDNSSYSADYLVLCTPAQSAASLLSEINPGLSHKLECIPRSQAILVNLVYWRKDIRHPLNGFGFVTPRTENMLISACSFSSVKFNARTSADKVLFRIFTGGLLKPQAMQLTDNDVIRQCKQELQTLLGIKSDAIMQLVTRHSEGIPQYLVGHTKLLSEIYKEAQQSPGIELAGNSYTGVGLPDCIRSAKQAAAKIMATHNELGSVAKARK